MKLNKFELEKKMSIADMRMVKAGSGDCTSGSFTSHGTNGDSDGVVLSDW